MLENTPQIESEFWFDICYNFLSGYSRIEAIQFEWLQKYNECINNKLSKDDIFILFRNTLDVYERIDVIKETWEYVSSQDYSVYDNRWHEYI